MRSRSSNSFLAKACKDTDAENNYVDIYRI